MNELGLLKIITLRGFNIVNNVISTDNAWMISGLKLSSTLPKVATKS